MIQALDSEKAHCHDRISIQMVEICRLSICKPLDIIFKLCIESGLFPLEWEKAHAASVHKKWPNNLKQTNRRFHFFPYMKKYFNVCDRARCIIFHNKPPYFRRAVRLVSITSYQLPRIWSLRCVSWHIKGIW